jgi:probable rRNA maturation factor
VDPDSKRVPPSRLGRLGERGRHDIGGPRVTVTDGRGGRVRDGGLARWLAACIPARVVGDVAVALVTDRHIRTLNGQYRGKNSPTDVLSFPWSPEPRASSADRRTPSADRRAPNADTYLGDIVIAAGVAKRQAREARHSYGTELRVLALHGLLHLLGYDHDDPEDRGRMARAEARLRRKGGLREGLIARNRPPSRPRRPTR